MKTEKEIRDRLAELQIRREEMHTRIHEVCDFQQFLTTHRDVVVAMDNLYWVLEELPPWRSA